MIEQKNELKDYADGWITERKGTDVTGFLKLAYIVIAGGATGTPRTAAPLRCRPCAFFRITPRASQRRRRGRERLLLRSVHRLVRPQRVYRERPAAGWRRKPALHCCVDRCDGTDHAVQRARRDLRHQRALGLGVLPARVRSVVLRFGLPVISI